MRIRIKLLWFSRNGRQKGKACFIKDNKDTGGSDKLILKVMDGTHHTLQWLHTHLVIN